MDFLASKQRKYYFAGLLAVTIGGFAFTWWHGVRAHVHPEFETALGVVPTDEGYVGSQVCAGCHQAVAEKYQGHPMAHSLHSISEASAIEDYDERPSFQHPESRLYRVERTGDRIVHHESMTDDEGATVYDQAVDIRYVLGSGRRGRSYLIDRGGLLYASPIAWYSASRRWDAAPGYTPRAHPRFERRINDTCLACHSGRLAFDRRFPNRYAAPPFLEEAIGCERCHGPGAEHVRLRSTGDAPASADPIVNPSKLDGPSRQDVCNQCHLPEGGRILRYGRSFHDFRPGQRLDDVWVVFDDAAQPSGAGSSRAADQVRQMRASRCFEGSGGRLECLSCHDPHGVPSENDRPVFYNERCLNCHRDKGCSLASAERDADPAAGSCIACHMPPLATSDIPHTAQTDHRIVRVPKGPTSRQSRELQIFDDANARLPSREIDRAKALMRVLQLDRRPDADTITPLVSTLISCVECFPDDVDALESLGILSLYQNRPADAERFWRQALRHQPSHESILQHLAVLQGQSKNIPDAIATTRQMLRCDPWQAGYHLQLAEYLDDAGDQSQALIEVERALTINPTLLSVREWLAAVYRQNGRLDDAVHEERTIDRMRQR